VRKQGRGIISTYQLDEGMMKNNISVKDFGGYTEEWLDYIAACRSGRNIGKYDVVIGGVANDRVFDTIELFFDGLIDKSVAIERLKYQKPNLQVCFCSQEVIDNYLKFIGSEMIS